MKRAILFCLAALVAPIAAQAAERTYSISDFERIRVIGPFRVDVVADRMTTARAKGSNDALDRVRLDVQGRTLTIRLDRSGLGSSDLKGPPATVTIKAPALREAALAGSGVLTLSGMKGLRVGVILEGSGQVSASNIQADRLDVAAIGTGTIGLAGAARSATVTSKGTASVNGDGLATDDLAVTWESGGDGAFAARRTAKVTSIGTGNVTVAGKPACTVANGGNGQVSCGE